MLSTKSTFSGFFRYFFDLIFGHTTGTYFFFLLDTPHSLENTRSDITEAPDELDHELHGPLTGVEVTSDLESLGNDNDLCGFEA